MSMVGLLFLLFEGTIMEQSKSARGAYASAGQIGLPRIILGIQVSMLQTPTGYYRLMNFF